MHQIKAIEVENLQRVEFKKAEIVPGDDKTPFYLSVVYEFENLYGVYELKIPKINIGPFFAKDYIPAIRRDEEIDIFDRPGRLNLHQELPAYIDYSFSAGRLYLEKIGDSEFEIKTIKEKEKEMTLKDIEKALGYKVKIIS